MGRVIYILTFYYIYVVLNYHFLEDVMLLVIVLLGVFIHSALGGSNTQETQIGKSTDRFILILCGYSHSMWII